ncbi:hypothetical protein [Nonomuraea bangladeshensis]|uniref:hypothetical protein n=1 Tax=Nonomuraea bangladeshensis TaxID=404385 RepID=UPI003C2B0FEE
MGLDITVLIVDWAHVKEAPPDQRLELLMGVACSADGSDLEDPERGWMWPSVSAAPWFARYEFYRTLGSLKAHFWAGQAWEEIRGFADPDLRVSLDGFLSGLFWYGPDPANDAVHVHGDLFPADIDRSRGLSLAYPPEAVPALVKSWVKAAPRLEELREPFAAHAARPPGHWIENFEEFADLLNDWGEVVREADSRGWGLIGFTS